MKNATLAALCALLAATLACSIFVGGPAYTPSAVADATQPTQSLADHLQQAIVKAGTTGVVSLDITEAQLTSFLAAKLAAQTHPVMTDPLVTLRNGQMTVYGKVTSGIFVANVSLSVQASVDSSGQPKFDVTQTDFGPVAAPQALNDALASLIQEAFTGWLGPVATGFRLDSITIGDGVMTVSGRIK